MWTRNERLSPAASAGLVRLAWAAALLCASCGFVDLREVAVRTEPAASGAVLPARDTPVRVIFGAETDRREAEEAFSVTSETGAVEGDVVWEGSSFSFVPTAGWLSGVRYRLILAGTISCDDGREARPEIDLTFTAVRAAGAPILVKAFPAHGSSTGTKADEGAVIVLRFSEAMDERSVEEAFGLEPSAELDFAWSEADTVLTASPRLSFSPCVSYRWTLDADACAADGAPLASESSGLFTTDGDRTAPRVVRSYSALRAGGAWVDTGRTLADLGPGEAVAIEFSEPMVADSLRGAVRVEPSVSGLKDVRSPTTIVFIPDSPPAFGVPLTLVVAADAADLAGLTLGTDYREVFVPSVRPLSVLAIAAGSGEKAAPPFSKITPKTGSELDVALTAPDGLLTLTIRFSSSFAAVSRAAAVDLISLSVFFPGTLVAPELRSASWPSSDTISLTWEGLSKSAVGAPCLYLLSIDGGTGGLSDGAGLVLAADALLLLETKL